MKSNRCTSPRAFTLLELLIVIALIALLASLVLVAFAGVNRSSQRTTSLNALRQLGQAFNSYAADHRGQFMPGYLGSAGLTAADDVVELGITADHPRPTSTSGSKLQPGDSRSYVWRLAPYVDNVWQVMFKDIREKGLITAYDNEFRAGMFGPATATGAAVGIANTPSFGMNSIFVGGDTFHGGPQALDFNPWNTQGNKTIAARRLSDVKNPSKLILFAPTAPARPDGAGTGSGSTPEGTYLTEKHGYCELRAPFTWVDASTPSKPFWANNQWAVGPNGRIIRTSEGDYTDGCGLPIDRTGGTTIPVAHLDGSGSLEEFGVISRDMSRWSPFDVFVKPTQVLN